MKQRQQPATSNKTLCESRTSIPHKHIHHITYHHAGLALAAQRRGEQHRELGVLKGDVRRAAVDCVDALLEAQEPQVDVDGLAHLVSEDQAVVLRHLARPDAALLHLLAAPEVRQEQRSWAGRTGRKSGRTRETREGTHNKEG